MSDELRVMSYELRVTSYELRVDGYGPPGLPKQPHHYVYILLLTTSNSLQLPPTPSNSLRLPPTLSNAGSLPPSLSLQPTSPAASSPKATFKPKPKPKPKKETPETLRAKIEKLHEKAASLDEKVIELKVGYRVWGV